MILKRDSESDSVYAIDDNTILFVGFTTDESGLSILIPKLVKRIKGIVRKEAVIKIGEAIFPRDGYSFYELIHVIEKRLNAHAAPKKKIQPLSLKKEVPKVSEALKPNNNFPVNNSLYSNLYNSLHNISIILA